MQQDRRHERKPFAHSAQVTLGDGSSPQPCEILDISDGGAKIRLMKCEVQELPEMVFLLLANGKVRRSCKVAWRFGLDVGVQFRKP
jgi:hypothetical protein